MFIKIWLKARLSRLFIKEWNSLQERIKQKKYFKNILNLGIGDEDFKKQIWVKSRYFLPW